MNTKTSRKATLSLILLVLFTVALLILTVLTAWRNNAATNLESAVNDLGKESGAVSLADKSIEKFFNVENAFRLYTVTGAESYRSQYTTGLRDLKKMLDSLERSVNTNVNGKSSLRDLLKQKNTETNMFLRLKGINDSLIRAASELKNFQPVVVPVFKPLNTQEVKAFVEKTTVVQDQPSQKKLLGRIKDAIVNKAPTQTSTVTTVNRIENTASGKNDLTVDALNDLLKSAIEKLTYNYRQLNENEKQLVLGNDRLLTRLSSILRELKQLENDINVSRERQLNNNARLSLQELSNITRITLLISVILALVILFIAWRLYKHEKRLVADKAEAIRQTRLRSDFLSHMSHEIRTPLNSILGFSEQLESSSLNNIQKEQVFSIRQSSKILLSIVNDILDLSKFETGNLNLHTSNFYPEKTIKHVVSSLQVLAAKKNITLLCDCDMTEGLRVAGDEYRLKQVLINLINNGIKFTDSGSVRVDAKMSDTSLFVEISDTGRGIAGEDLKTIFDEFIQITRHQDNERHNGSGLGLAISKKIVDAQDGEISVRSEPGKGSVFSFSIPYLPFQESLETDVKKEVKPALDITAFDSKSILVAEDDNMNIKLITTILNKWGLTFDIVENGTLAFEMFREKSYDMILTDIHMPQGDGISLTKLIRDYPDKMKSGIPIVAITANAMEKDLDQYQAIGMNDHIVKPFTEVTLYEKMRKNMSGNYE